MTKFDWGRVPAFSGWLHQKLEEYIQRYPEADGNPYKSPRKGIPPTPGQEYPYPLTKYGAACACILVGKPQKKQRKVKIDDVLRLLGTWHITPNIIYVWRNEERFQKTVAELRSEFARFWVRSVYDSDSLVRDKKALVKESSLYPVEVKYEVEGLVGEKLDKIASSQGSEKRKWVRKIWLLHVLINLDLLCDPERIKNKTVLNKLQPVARKWSPEKKKSEEEVIEDAKDFNLHFLEGLVNEEISKLAKKENHLDLDDISYGVESMRKLIPINKNVNKKEKNPR